MAYLVLARKYRPQQFAELVGQQHVAQTLLNAFRQEKVGQAYLFTGTRGVGKTSAARILAKALRCQKPPEPGIACDKCSSCKEINDGNSLDVLEIDGASNNGVDNIREIRENVKFLPSSGKKKVFIVDEVHMLTGAAFNALLKTLEEPPPHVAFILATTDVQKIPATILSRCQRFDFRRVPQPVIADYLHQIAEKEKIKAEPAALRLIARKADGSVRDALSLMDQVIALTGSPIAQDKAVEILGVVDGQFLAQLLGHIFSNRLNEALQLVHQAFLAGIEMKQLALDLSESFRNALLVKLGSPDALLELSSEEKKSLTEAVQNTSQESIQAAFKLSSQSLEEISRSPMPRASLEMLVARIASFGRLASLEELLQRLTSGAAPMARPSISQTMTATTSAAAPSTIAQAAATTPVITGPLSWQGFVSFVSSEKPSIGAVLEHALPLTLVQEWKSAANIAIGFKAQHGFYLEQLKVKTNFSALESLLGRYLDKKVVLRLEEYKTPVATPASASLADAKEASQSQNLESAKKKFLQEEIVKNTQEIFGAQLSSFDINKPK